MDIIIPVAIWFLTYRFVVGKFRTWVEADPHVMDLPLPLWLYLVFAVLAAVPAVVVAVLLP